MSAAEVRLIRLAMLIVLLMLPWSGLWRVAHADAAVRFSAVNAALMPLVALFVAILDQLVVVAVARRLGDDVLCVHLGFGPKILERQVDKIEVVWRAFPALSSNAIVSPSARRQRSRIVAARLSGLLIIAIPAVIYFAAYSQTTVMKQCAFRVAPDVLFAMIGTVYVMWGGLLSFTYLLRNDPMILRKARSLYWANRAAREVELGAFDQAAVAAQRGLEDSPDDVTLQFVLASARTTAGHGDALELLKRLRERELPDALRCPTLNMWAWECYMRGDLARGADADDASRIAVEMQPDDPSCLDTRGHVLVWLGRPHDAEICLQRAYKAAPSNAKRGCAAAGLAMLCASTNRPADAASWLLEARQLGCEQRILARATSIVDPLNRV